MSEEQQNNLMNDHDIEDYTLDIQLLIDLAGAEALSYLRRGPCLSPSTFEAEENA